MYYKVKAKCGHVGRNWCIDKTFYVEAADGKEAAIIVRYKPRVKHDHKYAIESVDEIDKSEYLAGKMANRNDPYFTSKSIQEQRRKCPSIDTQIRYEEKKVQPKKTQMRSRLVAESKEKEQLKEIRNRDYEQD